MSAILKFDFQKKKTITCFWSKLSKLHKKDPILHVTATFSLKQGETRTNIVLIPHPLTEEEEEGEKDVDGKVGWTYPEGTHFTKWRVCESGI